ncbi:class I SAM-dependent methyltransferase [Deinococcus sp. UYEF24]
MSEPSHEQHGPSEARQYWENRYRENPRPWTGRPNAILARWVRDLAPGTVMPGTEMTGANTPRTALDLGCSEGNSAVWLAAQGWKVTGVDISATALARAEQHAAEAGVAEHTDFQQHDLEHTFPTGRFSLVYALYLQSPVAFQRDLVLRKAAAAVEPGGLLLVIEHASAPSWHVPQTPYPTVQQALETIELDLKHWEIVFQDTPEREVTELTGPNGEVGLVKDNILALRRKHDQEPFFP